MTELTCCCSPQNIPRKVFTKQLTNTSEQKNSIDCQLMSPKSSGSISFCSEDTTSEDESSTSFDTDHEGIVELCIRSLQLTPYVNIHLILSLSLQQLICKLMNISTYYRQ